MSQFLSAKCNFLFNTDKGEKKIIFLKFSALFEKKRKKHICVIFPASLLYSAKKAMYQWEVVKVMFR